jgi:hypothetical protein
LRYFSPTDIYQLYNIADDYKEQYDLSDKYPARVGELKKILVRECDGDLSNGLFDPNKMVSYN